MKSRNYICLLFFGLLLFEPNSIYGQVLHTIIFADTNDPKIGESVLRDYYGISVEVSTIASATGMKLKKYFYKGNECSNKNLRSMLANLRTNRNDVILFYYSGHGTRAINDKSDFPQMCLGSSYDSQFYPLEKVLKDLERQPARLKLIFGDCCNSVVNGVTPKEYETKSVTVLSKEPVNVYNNLFNHNKGFLIASGSSKGEVSICVNLKDGSPAGGAFTFSFLNVLNHYASSGLTTTWDDIMGTTQSVTHKIGKHTPIYAVRIKDDTTSNTTYHEPQNTALGDDIGEINKITQLTAIGNENLTVEKRVRLQDKALRSIFSSPNTKVEIVGSNGFTVVATEKASDFVLRLCTTHNLVNLVEVDCKENKIGKYDYLKVHEIYKK